MAAVALDGEERVVKRRGVSVVVCNESHEGLVNVGGRGRETGRRRGGGGKRAVATTK